MMDPDTLVEDAILFLNIYGRYGRSSEPARVLRLQIDHLRADRSQIDDLLSQICVFLRKFYPSVLSDPNVPLDMDEAWARRLYLDISTWLRESRLPR